MATISIPSSHLTPTQPGPEILTPKSGPTFDSEFPLHLETSTSTLGSDSQPGLLTATPISHSQPQIPTRTEIPASGSNPQLGRPPWSASREIGSRLGLQGAPHQPRPWTQNHRADTTHSTLTPAPASDSGLNPVVSQALAPQVPDVNREADSGPLSRTPHTQSPDADSATRLRIPISTRGQTPIRSRTRSPDPHRDRDSDLGPRSRTARRPPDTGPAQDSDPDSPPILDPPSLTRKHDALLAPT